MHFVEYDVPNIEAVVLVSNCALHEQHPPICDDAPGDCDFWGGTVLPEREVTVTRVCEHAGLHIMVKF